MRDNAQNELTVGDKVVWACRKGSAMWLSRGTIIAVYAKGIAVVRDYPTPTRQILLTTSATILKVAEC